jgi:hypothetical protein
MNSGADSTEWLKKWTTHARSLALLRDWDSTCGVLLASHDGSAEEAIPSILALLSPEYTTEVHPDFSKAQWNEATGLLQQYQIQHVILDGPLPKKIYLIVHRLDECPRWMLSSLQGLFERSSRPFHCIATTDQLEKISGQYRSFFDEWQKIGRPHSDSRNQD